MPEVVRLKSRDTVEQMIQSHGSASWYGKKERFERAEYFVAVSKETRLPILIGEIDAVIPVPDSGPDRHNLRFKRYALLDPDDVEFIQDNGQNPAVNLQLSKILPHLDVDSLPWQTVGKKTLKYSFGNEPQPSPKAKTSQRGLTIAEAKRGLAVGLGISEDTITISISS